MLYNLLSNAIKFTPTGGTILVKLQLAGSRCLLQVQDTGIGIRAEQLPHLFERFRQAEGSANRSHEGSGLGLALAKELVELHGGQVSVESVYGEGSMFTVWLPTGTAHLPPEQVLEVPTEIQVRRAAVELADVELIEPTDESFEFSVSSSELNSNETQSKLNQNSVLVVEDNPDLRTYVSSILAKQGGYRVLTARNGAEGLRVVQSQFPNLIVTDLMMPQLSGLEMISLIRKQDRLKGTPIILLTAKVDEETRIEGTESGADAYLSKPFNDRELLAEVRNLLALKQMSARCWN